MTGLELMTKCGYDISHLIEADAETFWMESMRTGIVLTGPRAPMEALAESLRKKRTVPQEIYRCYCGGLIFCVVRSGDTVYVDVLNLSDGEPISRLVTWIAPWASNAPQHGNAYYWEWNGLNYSTSAIAP